MPGPLPTVPLASVAIGAVRFDEGNVSDTYRGQVLLSSGEAVAAILKDLPAKELANELLGATMARAVALPVPDHFLAVVRDDVLPVAKGPFTLDGQRLVFASADVGEPSVQYRYRHDRPNFAGLMMQLLAWPRLGELYGFDAWSANVDRHAGNLLFGGGERVWLIDHGRILTGDRWQVPKLDPAGDFDHRLYDWLTDHLSAAQQDRAQAEAAHFERALRTDPMIDEIVSASRVEALLTSDELTSVVRFLRERIDFIIYYANKALGRATLA